MSAAPPADVDLLDEDVLADPYPALAALREADPVSWSERYGAWMVTGYEACAAAHTDERISSDRITPVLRKVEAEDGSERLTATLRVLAGWMVFKDGAEHRRLRHLMQRSFTPRTVERLHERVVEICDELLDEMFRAPVAGTGDLRATSHEPVAGTGDLRATSHEPVAGTGDLRATSHEPDLVGQVAAPLPAAVIADMLGAPAQDRDRFRRWSEDIVALVFGAQEDDERHERAIAGMGELVDYLDALVAAKRAAPEEDLISLTLRPGSDGDDALSEDEIVAMGTLLLFGGSETTTNLIGSGLLALMRHREQRALLAEDPGLAGGAVEELLRYDGPARISVRVVGSDLELGGHELRAGQRVFLVLAAANRDPGRFERPDELDITRDTNPHLGFGLGRHYCLGASLARLEGRTVIPRVLERLGDVEPATAQLGYNPFLISRSLRALPVRPRPRATA